MNRQINDTTPHSNHPLSQTWERGPGGEGHPRPKSVVRGRGSVFSLRSQHAHVRLRSIGNLVRHVGVPHSSGNRLAHVFIRLCPSGYQGEPSGS